MSSPVKDGGSAFPQEHRDLYSPVDRKIVTSLEGHQGMTMRQYYKASALQGLLSSPNATQSWIDSFAVVSAGKIADSMIAEDAEHAKNPPYDQTTRHL